MNGSVQLNWVNIVNAPDPGVSHPGIQSTSDQKYSGEKLPDSSKTQNVNLPATICIAVTLFLSLSRLAFTLYQVSWASLVVQTVKNLPAMQETWVSIPGSGSSPGEGHGSPLQCSCLENPHGQRSLAGYSPWGHTESDVTERLSTEVKYTGGFA